MLEPRKVRRVRELLATGQYTLNQIARDSGVSRATVQRIARGARRRQDPAAVDPADELSVSLTPDERKRYENVRQAKARREAPHAA